MISQSRPLAFFDIETTGTNVNEDRVVEICVVRRDVDGRETTLTSLVNPERSIPAEASSIHGITDEKVRSAPTFKDLAPKLLAILDGADLAGFNVLAFDIPLLANEFKRVGAPVSPSKRNVVDAFLIFKRLENHSLASAARFYCGFELSDAHHAEVDVRATAAVLDAQIAYYQSLPKDVAGLAAWLAQKDPKHVDHDGKFVWRGEEAVLGFGKYRGVALREVDHGFLRWMLGADFSSEVKDIARKALAGEFPVRRAS